MSGQEPTRAERQQRLDEAQAIVEALRIAEESAGSRAAAAEGAPLLYPDAERLIRGIMEMMREGAAMLDERGRVLHCNTRLGEMLQRPTAQLVGSSFASFVHPDHADKWQAAFGSRGVQPVVGFTLEVLVAEGLPVPVHIVLHSLEQGPGRIAFLVAYDLAWQEERMKQLERANRELAAQRDALEEVATTDSMTGAYTSAAVFDVLETELGYGRRYGRPVSMLLIDIDHFKPLNDSYGHAFGDTILREFCDRCREAIRATDYLVRYGGDEFAVILPQTDATGARAVGDRILGSVRAVPFGQHPRSVPVTISVGVATAMPQEGVRSKALLGRADQALYEVKQHGRDGLASWDDKSRTRHGRL